ncbi:hypothetical protein A3A39_03455 [Candidatus Kaiserbacteria bacterium RIFCSPLOWO2_01_FULL_54_13]|uniref:Uncharacterized protein n=1 Tax=Candidatus Kaiserbacteria bacterium RIFCSPLOWO2_01_FULL_54_13 TaxID=1798512 RepID=A0A1F6F359_9BACT|nr:MAG: hypothetical protein A3A39_03455 [Candidatus Kaiserbacteria bacterium RIFCSPLOWO2_01_FULL_54_13]
MVAIQKSVQATQSILKRVSGLLLLVVGFLALLFASAPRIFQDSAGYFGSGIAHADAPKGCDTGYSCEQGGGGGDSPACGGGGDSASCSGCAGNGGDCSGAGGCSDTGDCGGDCGGGCAGAGNG